MALCSHDRSNCLFIVVTMQVILPSYPYFYTMNLIRHLVLVCMLTFSISLLPQDAVAQCPMCKMSAESNLKNGGTAGKGLNTGILYMLALPYTLVGVIGFIWWRNNRRHDEVDEVEVLP